MKDLEVKYSFKTIMNIFNSNKDIKYILSTVSPSNKPSQRVFEISKSF